MFVKSLELKDFRNYRALSLAMKEGSNIFYGSNAQGKTNILEAMYLAGTTRSHKGAKDRDIIRAGCEESHIRMILVRNDNEYRVDIHLRKNMAKGVAVNGIPVRRAAELFHIATFVFFSPEDLSMIKNGPAGRRRFLDQILCSTDRLYFSELSRYGKILNQRNALLRELSMDNRRLSELDIWDMQLAEYGKKIVTKRRDFIRTFREEAAYYHRNLSGGREEMVMAYEPNTDEEYFEDRIAANREKDIRTRMTNAGPHRDDIGFSVGGMDLRTYGSQGQQRTAALSLKMAEIRRVEEARGDKPVLLLDDVLSELDSERQKELLSCIRDTQTMITCTGLDDFVAHHFPADRTFRVVEGRIEGGVYEYGRS